jgi:CheY-like chemotaxis protein
MKGRSLVLLVDDNDAGRMLVRALLQSAGLRVDSSGLALEALKRAKRAAPRTSPRITLGPDRVA